MALRLSELLDEPDILVESAVKKLEHISGWQSTDVRLLAEVDNKVRAKIAELNLDPDDTTGMELYQALLVKLGEHEKNINLSTSELFKRISQAHKNYKVYALKNSVAKELLRHHPPRKLMKMLNYRSVDSMLKRENPGALFAAVANAESLRWQNVFYKDLAKLTPSDFETRDATVVSLEAKYKNLIQSDTQRVTLLGAVVTAKSQESKVALAASIVNEINKLRSESAIIKLRNVEAGFGYNLVEIVQGQAKHPLKISHLPVSWHTIFNQYGKRPVSEHTEFFGPHILHEDIKAHETVKSLAEIFPALSWWQDLEHVAYKAEQGIVSLNLLDVISSKTKDFNNRELSNYKKSLWHEFISRYFAHPSVEQHFMNQLEPQTVPVSEFPQANNPEQEISRMMEIGV
jgi:hypothetical protein